MKKLWLLLLFISPGVFSGTELTQPELAALKFNKWYIGQLKADRAPLADISTLAPYIANDTLKALKELYSGDSNDKELPDADMFIKAQDFDDDWGQIGVIRSDADAVCTNVYISFGKKKEHVVADCMMQESGKWKVRSVTLINDGVFVRH